MERVRGLNIGRWARTIVGPDLEQIEKISDMWPYGPGEPACL